MKKFLTAALLLMAAISLKADPASFKGGHQALLSFLGKHVKYPAVAAENGIEGKVLVKFIVKVDGSIAEPRIVRPVDPSLEAEAIRVINMMPAWEPATDSEGNFIDEEVTVPVHFRLS